MNITPYADLHRDTLCFSIYNNHEHGRFYLRHGSAQHNDKTKYWAELVCHTSFGTVGDYWGHCLPPHKFFYEENGKGYFANKLWGDKQTVWDSDACVDSTREVICSDRREGRISRDEARERWDDLPTYYQDNHEWVEYVRETDWLYQRACDGHLNETILNPQMLGFFKELWPHFLEAVRKHWELTHPTCSECSAELPTRQGELKFHKAGCSQIPF